MDQAQNTGKIPGILLGKLMSEKPFGIITGCFPGEKIPGTLEGYAENKA